MTEVLHSPPPSSTTSSCSSPPSLSCAPSSSPKQPQLSNNANVTDCDQHHQQQLSLLALLLALFRKSFWVACNSLDGKHFSSDIASGAGGGMEIGWPTNVRHVAHVTFDRFNGFLGLPVEFQPDVPCRAPSARY